jgi:hypothetical protein
MANKALAPPGGFSPLEFQALRIVGKDAADWRDAVAVGIDQQVDFLAWIQMIVDVDADGFRTATSRPTDEELLAFAYAFSSPQKRQQMHAELLKAFHNGKRPAADDDARHLARIALERITTSEQKPRAGAVRGRDIIITRLPRSLASYKSPRRKT